MRKSFRRRRGESRGMRSIQYEKTEATKGNTARRRSGFKESNKVGGKKKECLCSDEGERKGRIQRRRREKQKKRQSEGHEVSLANKKKTHQQRRAGRLHLGEKWATSRTRTHMHTQRREDAEQDTDTLRVFGMLLCISVYFSVFVRLANPNPCLDCRFK